ncbi:hypothetical protein THAOC_10044, partial [Thalassiosira oceanica]
VSDRVDVVDRVEVEPVRDGHDRHEDGLAVGRVRHVLEGVEHGRDRDGRGAEQVEVGQARLELPVDPVHERAVVGRVPVDGAVHEVEDVRHDLGSRGRREAPVESLEDAELLAVDLLGGVGAAADVADVGARGGARRGIHLDGHVEAGDDDELKQERSERGPSSKKGRGGPPDSKETHRVDDLVAEAALRHEASAPADHQAAVDGVLLERDGGVRGTFPVAIPLPLEHGGQGRRGCAPG